MNALQFSEARKIAESDADLTAVNYDVMIGYGTKDFQPVHITLEAVAKMMRYQAMQLHGQWDSVELSDMAYLARKRFIII